MFVFVIFPHRLSTEPFILLAGQSIVSLSTSSSLQWFSHDKNEIFLTLSLQSKYRLWTRKWWLKTLRSHNQWWILRLQDGSNGKKIWMLEAVLLCVPRLTGDLTSIAPSMSRIYCQAKPKIFFLWFNSLTTFVVITCLSWTGFLMSYA